MKPYKTIKEQLDILRSRNVIVGNERFARRVLTYENYYYVINGYKAPFISSTVPDDVYKKGTTFNEIVALYSFDRKLRELLMPDLLRIEHCVKATVIDTFSQHHGHDHTAYLRPESFNSVTFENFRRTNALIFELIRLLDPKRQRHDAVRHYLNKYGAVPLWVLSKVMTFGKLNSFYGCMLDADKKEVAAAYGLDARTFKSIIDFLAIFRNKCAHGERVYCHARDQQPPRPIPELPMHQVLDIPRNRKGYKFGTNDILALLIAVRYFAQSQRYDHLLGRIDFALNTKLASRLHTIPIEDIREIMGLECAWKEKLAYAKPQTDKQDSASSPSNNGK